MRGVLGEDVVEDLEECLVLGERLGRRRVAGGEADSKALARWLGSQVTQEEGGS